MTQAEEIKLLTAEFGDGWEFEDDEYTYQGEHCDGDPTWTVRQYGDEWVVKYECGWYEQQGDARDISEVIVLMHAMEAASKTLEEHLYRAAMSEMGRNDGP